jgi:hypothetical protein
MDGRSVRSKAPPYVAAEAAGETPFSSRVSASGARAGTGGACKDFQDKRPKAPSAYKGGPPVGQLDRRPGAERT